MLTDHAGLSRFERLLTLFTRVRPGEGRSAFLFFLHAFLLLFSYQVVKALREAFMLTKFPAEVRAYADLLPRGTYWELESPHGHDAFLMDPGELPERVRDFIAG